VEHKDPQWLQGNSAKAPTWGYRIEENHVPDGTFLLQTFKRIIETSSLKGITSPVIASKVEERDKIGEELGREIQVPRGGIPRDVWKSPSSLSRFAE